MMQSQKRICLLGLMMVGSMVGSVLEAGATNLDQVIITSRWRYFDSYPCQQCHNSISTPGKTSRPAGIHDHIQLSHIPSVKNCNLCHQQSNPQNLLTITGDSVSFDDSYKICTQCHGEKGRDWQLGIHGKQIGKWNGIKTRYSCGECHDPHQPKYPKDRALPPPKFPKFGIPKQDH